MVVQVSCASAILWFRIAIFIATSLPKGLIRELVVVGKVEIVLNQRSASVGVIANTISMYDRINQWKRTEE